MFVVWGAILQVTVGYAMFVVCVAILQATVGYAMFVLLSRSAGNGRVCYGHRLGAISQVTVGYATSVVFAILLATVGYAIVALVTVGYIWSSFWGHFVGNGRGRHGRSFQRYRW